MSGALKGTYSYNALGQRTRKVVPVSGGNRTTHFMFGLGGELLGELAINPDGSRTFTDWYWLNSLPVARHVRALNTAGTQVSDTRTYLHPDHLGTPRLVTNASRQVIWRLDTDPFGDGSVTEDPDGNSVLEVMPLRFPGQYFDVEAGVAYNYFRDYDQGTGRYTQSDPVGLLHNHAVAEFSASIPLPNLLSAITSVFTLNHRFGYVDQSPLKYSDPFGLSKFDPLFGLEKKFWQWYHRKEKRPGDPDLDKESARELHREWKERGEPGPDSDRHDKNEMKNTKDLLTPLPIQLTCFMDPCNPFCEPFRPEGLECSSDYRC